MKTRVVVSTLLAVLVVAVLMLSVAVLTLLDRPTVTPGTGTVVLVSGDQDAIVLQTSDGRRETGALVSANGERIEDGDRVRFQMVSDPDVIFVEDVRRR